jgi:hypothetical protein
MVLMILVKMATMDICDDCQLRVGGVSGIDNTYHHHEERFGLSSPTKQG